MHDLLDCLDLGETPDGTRFPELGTRRLAVSVASGNGGNTTRVYPAAETRDGMLSVSATTRYDLLADFSSYDRGWVDVVAPGENIVSAIPGQRYGTWSGTSMAAPIVAGIAALVKAKTPNAFPTPHDLLNRIKETAYQRPDYTAAPWGSVRLFRVDALCAVMNNNHCTASGRLPFEFGIEEPQEK